MCDIIADQGQEYKQTPTSLDGESEGCRSFERVTLRPNGSRLWITNNLRNGMSHGWWPIVERVEMGLYGPKPVELVAVGKQQDQYGDTYPGRKWFGWRVWRVTPGHLGQRSPEIMRHEVKRSRKETAC